MRVLGVVALLLVFSQTAIAGFSVQIRQSDCPMLLATSPTLERVSLPREFTRMGGARVWRDALLEQGHSYGEFLAAVQQEPLHQRTQNSLLELHRFVREHVSRWFSAEWLPLIERVDFDSNGLMTGLGFHGATGFLHFFKSGGLAFYRRFLMTRVSIVLADGETDLLELAQKLALLARETPIESLVIQRPTRLSLVRDTGLIETLIASSELRRSLKELSLSGIAIGSEQDSAHQVAARVATVLLLFKNLISLTLSDAQLQAESYGSILRHGGQLRDLDLSGNPGLAPALVSGVYGRARGHEGILKHLSRWNTMLWY